LLTITRHQVKAYTDDADIKSVIMYLKLRLPTLRIIKDAYEIAPKYRNLHYHAHVTTEKRVYYRANSSYSGFRIHWKPINQGAKHLNYVNDYIAKHDINTLTREVILDTNYYTHNYGF